MRVFIFLISFVFVLVSCEVPEGTSNRKLVRVGPPGKRHLVYRKRNNSFDEKFTEDVFKRGLGPAVNDVVTPTYGGERCVQVALSVSEIKDSSEIDLLINEAFEKDASCKKVFTGNAGNTEAAGLPYAKTFAYSMIQDMCNPKSANVGELLSKPSLGYKDAMSLSLFNKGMKGTASVDNLATTYALMYALGQRESSGNFKRGRDISSSNTSALTKEAGPFQVSANSLNLYGKGDDKYFLRGVFKSYVDGLTEKSKEDKGSLCLVDKLAGSKETKPTVGTSDDLENLFSSGNCKGVKSKIEKIDFSTKTSTAACFRDLNKLCPSFAIKYGAGVARINRKHNGPLYTTNENRTRFKNSRKHHKPHLKPACHSIFKSLAENKEKVCKVNE